MLTEKDYCDYKTCVALKKLGYKEKTLAYYTSEGIFYWRRAYIYDVAIPDLAKSSNSNKELHKHIIDAMSLYEAQKWLREEKNIIVDVSFSPLGYFASMYTNVRNVESEILKERFKFEWSEKLYGEEDHDSYEGALLEGIKGAVKLLKEK